MKEIESDPHVKTSFTDDWGVQQSRNLSSPWIDQNSYQKSQQDDSDRAKLILKHAWEGTGPKTARNNLPNAHCVATVLNITSAFNAVTGMFELRSTGIFFWLIPIFYS